MLHLAIICIVCAASAPSEGTAFNIRKKNESNTICNSHGGEQNIAEAPFPSADNVIRRNSSDSAKPGIMFFYDYFIKQYQDSKSNSCSIMERIPLGENKNLHSDVDFIYKKRKLLWTTGENKFKPLTKRSPAGADATANPPPAEGTTENYKKEKTEATLKEKTKYLGPQNALKMESGREEKKMLLCLTRFKGREKKKEVQNSHLDMLKVDDDLDLNKRIKKLVEQLAEENRLKNVNSEEGKTKIKGKTKVKGKTKIKSKTKIKGMKEGETDVNDIKLSLLNNTKKMFIFNETHPESGVFVVKPVEVNNTRGGDPVSKKSKNAVSSYDVAKKMRKTLRFRRNPHNGHENTGSKDKKYFTGRSNPYSANFKGNLNSLTPEKGRKFIDENTKKRRGMREATRKYRSRIRMRDWPVLKSIFRKLCGKCKKSRGRCRCQNRKMAKLNQSSRLFSNNTLEEFPGMEETAKLIPETAKELDDLFKPRNPEVAVKGRIEVTTENAAERIKVKVEVLPAHSIEKPLLKKELSEKYKIKGLDYKYVTEYPLTGLLNPSKSLDETNNGINIVRYLRIRHMLRNNIQQKRIKEARKVRFMNRRIKRHGFASVCKNRRAAPLLCIPYVGKGQEDQLRYILKVIQNMMGKPQSSEIFEKIKFIPSRGTRDTPRGLRRGEYQALYPLRLPYQCSFPPTGIFLPCAPRHYVIASHLSYEPVRQKNVDGVPSARKNTTANSTKSNTDPELKSSHDTSPTKSPKDHPKPAAHNEQDTTRESFIPTPPESSGPSSPAPIHHTTMKVSVALKKKKPPLTDGTIATSTPTLVNPITPSLFIFYDDIFPTSPVTKSTTASARGHPSTVNSYVLQETETKIQKEVTSGTNKQEESTPKISHFSGGPAGESAARQGLTEERKPVAFDAHPSQYPEKLDSWSKSEERKRQATKHGHRFKKHVFKLNFKGGKSSSLWMKHIKEGCHDLLEKSGFRHSKLGNQNKVKCSRIENYQQLQQQQVQQQQQQQQLEQQQVQQQQHLEQQQVQRQQLEQQQVQQQQLEQQQVQQQQQPEQQQVQRQQLEQQQVQQQQQLEQQQVQQQQLEQQQQPEQQQVQQQQLEQQVQQQNVKVVQPPYIELRVVDTVTQIPLYNNNDYKPPYNRKPTILEYQSPGNAQQQKPERIIPLSGVFHKGRMSSQPEQNTGKYLKPTEETFLKRQKRADDYYDWSENDYNDYLFDSNRIDENQSSVKADNDQAIKESNSATTPSSYEMFSELAKAILQTEAGKESDTNGNGQDQTNSGSDTDSSQPTESTESSETEEPSAQPVAEGKPISKIKSKGKEAKKTRDRMPKFSGISKSLVDSREEKDGQAEEYLAPEDGHGPTTLKSASIARGQKKVVGKPSPKVYTKVFPDSFENDHESGESNIMTTETINVVKPTEQVSVSGKTDLRLKILAVCEGYLEVVKLIKAQNQSLREDMDENLARYCENIISQNFNFQPEKPKKLEKFEKFSDDMISSYNSRAIPEEGFRGIVSFQSSSDMASKREPHRRDSPSGIRTRYKRKKKRKKICMKPKTKRLSKLKGRIRKKKEAEEDSEGKGVTREQKQLIRLLRKRKKALLSWLLNTKADVKPEDLQETEYFDEEDLMEPEGDAAQFSGTVKPRRDKTSGTTKDKIPLTRKSIFPIYAKEYGYDRGGELIEVDILWRQVNDRTHENKIFKNLSVLALLMTSTHSPKIKHEDTKLAGDNELVHEHGLTHKKFTLEAANEQNEGDDSSKTSTDETEETMESPKPDNKRTDKISRKYSRKNRTHIFISKPDPKSIVGALTNASKIHRKISHKYGVAKDIFQEYSIEFLNYAVYILPMMFTILFLLCCLCCALQILKIHKCHKKRKKKKKKTVSSEESSDTGSSESESKKRKREAKRKRNTGSKENYENSGHKKKNKFWNYLKAYGRSREMEEESSHTDKKKSFLGFLRTKRDEGKPHYSSAPTHETDEEPQNYPEHRRHYSDQYLARPNRREEEKHKDDEHRENTERRELIALLEELKKIETDHIEGKKELKSVQVQYVTPEYDNTAFNTQMPAFSYPYEKNVFGMPKGISPFYNKKFQYPPNYPPPSADRKAYEDMNELTEMIPWTYYSHKNDFLKPSDFKISRTGRCDVFRDSGMRCSKPLIEKNCKKNESENRNFIFNKYKSISTDGSEELRGVTGQISESEVRLMENVSPYKLSSNRDEDLVEDVENFKCQLNKKVRLKDEGVLCRL